MPVLGICYGEQIDGGAARRRGRRRPSRANSAAPRSRSSRNRRCSTACGSGRRHTVWMSHGDRVTTLPPGFTQHRPLAERAVLRHRRRGAALLRPAVPSRSRCIRPTARRLLANFVHKVARLQKRLDHGAPSAPRRSKAIRAQVGQGRVLCGAVGRRRFVGRRRADPRGDRRQAHLRLRRSRPAAAGRGGGGRHAVPRPLQHPARPCGGRASCSSSALDGVADPEQKRKIIGRLFIDVFEAEAKKIAADGRGAPEFLAQGTLYPDVIESVSFTGGPSRDHQVASQCRRPAGAHEHEARRAACANFSRTRCARSAANSACRRLSSAAIRSRGRASPSACPAASRREKLDILRKADAVYLDEIRKAGLYDEIWQAFAVLLPVQTRRRDGRRAHL